MFLPQPYIPELLSLWIGHERVRVAVAELFVKLFLYVEIHETNLS